ncbi:hypothetical protein CN204_20420 [Sinorhizobium meliloti]|uniref:hypothetical protein n=1 Tax=Sinorhizobium TaxID=28105 RepID=UPI0002EFC5C5|nr:MULTISPECIES: hypothetical protein [Sinorhizobium]MDW9600131.1 hypothetical protein [Sinorhizobium meliloti]MDW9823523.1 hypothetical protein [Sinorhizobium meliloti]MDW9866391.1 hypothetical protein [Sinorhizobium meliloti]MDX0603865.1 hypothetical protein [Sinorhizobium medicae]MDX0819383.1 hypothetical protein [Sinorhizobium medicae]
MVTYDIEGGIFIRFAMIGRPVLNGLAAKGQRRKRDQHCATLFAHDIVGALRRTLGFRRQGEPVDDAAVEEFLATVIWDIPVEDFVVLVGIDATPRDAMKRSVSKRLAERLTTEFEFFTDPGFYHGHSGTGPLGPSQ